MSWAEKSEARAVHRGHVFTLIDLARALRAGLERVPQSQEALRGRGPTVNDDHSKHVDRLTEPFPPETWLDWCDGDIEQLAVDAIEELHRRGKLNAYMERLFAL